MWLGLPSHQGRSTTCLKVRTFNITFVAHLHDLLTLCMPNIFKKCKHECVFSVILQYWNNTGNWNSYSKKTDFNSLAPGRPGCHFETAIFNLVLLIGIFTSSNYNALRWMPLDLTEDKSTLVQVMAWCRQATSHYLSQCWPSSMSPYGLTRQQWVKTCADVT